MMKIVFNKLFMTIILLLSIKTFTSLSLNSLRLIKSSHSVNKVSHLSTLRLSTTNEFVIDEQELIKRINDEIYAKEGVELEDLINPSKVVNYEKEIMQLENDLTYKTSPLDIDKINDKIDKIKVKLATEKRAVMRGWLKNLFIFQSVLAIFASLLMVYDAYPGIHIPLSVKVLGFWMWWLFIIPSLRARKPSFAEKEALNIAFLLTPVVSIAMPVFTKDVAVIWWVNLATVVMCYVYAFIFKSNIDPDDFNENNSTLPSYVVKAIKALDYGSGRERGVRK